MQLSAFQALEERKKKKDTHKERLKDEPATDGEGVTAVAVAPLVQTMKFFEPSGRAREEIAKSGEVVGSHRADGAGQKQGEWNGVESRGPKKDEKNN